MTNQPFPVSQFDPDQAEQEKLARVGVVRVPQQVPWPIEPVNITIVKGETLALVDAGLRHLDNMERLEQALGQLGHQVEDIDELWLTHPHLDHFGLAGEIVSRSQAKTYALDSSVSRYHQYIEHSNVEREWRRETYHRAGVPADLIERSMALPSNYWSLATPVEIKHTFAPGEQVVIAGRPAEVLHVPGHSPWCSAFWMEQERLLLSGDALLRRITSNPLLYPPDVGPPRSQGWPAYRRSLKSLQAIPAAIVVPGHGHSFDQHQAVVERALAAQKRRQSKAIAALQEGLTSPFALASALFGEQRAQAGLFLVMSETLRHLDWLVEEGVASKSERDGQWHYHLQADETMA